AFAPPGRSSRGTAPGNEGSLRGVSLSIVRASKEWREGDMQALDTDLTSYPVRTDEIPWMWYKQKSTVNVTRKHRAPYGRNTASGRGEGRIGSGRRGQSGQLCRLRRAGEPL